jgi:geranylgeranyl diphosphate synthase type II
MDNVSTTDHSRPPVTSSLEPLRSLVEQRIACWCAELPPGTLYAPMAYLMELPAKRVRPVAVLIGCELFGGRAEDALDEALGIELFHNFTLMHDDIMDHAPLRRGRPTVHERWSVNAAILSGDAMLVKAYQLMTADPRVTDLFSAYALQVCEGQQLDMDFEQEDGVTLAAYRGMIRLKTAVLLSCALQVGALRAGAPDAERERLGQVGEHLGLAFQLRDDLLDAFGDPDRVGKQVGGDLRAGKKTWLLIRGLETLACARALRTELAKPPAERDVPAMITALERAGVRAEAEAEVERLDTIALRELDALQVPEERKVALRELAALLKGRTH